MSEQWTAPHMFKQQAKATRILPGSFISAKYSNKSSITALTTPEASVAAEWQCTQPCVCPMAEIELPKGRYRLFVSGKDYLPFRHDTEVDADKTIKAELDADRGPSDADLWP